VSGRALACKNESLAAGMVICLERGANDLHMIQLIPLTNNLLLHSNPDWFNFSAPSLLRLSWKKGH